MSLRLLRHGRERVGEQLPLPPDPVLGQKLRRAGRGGHLPHPGNRRLGPVVEEVAALGQQGVGAYAEPSRPPAPRSSRRGPSVPVSSAASGFQPFSFTARRLSSSRKPTRSFRRCAVRVRRASRTASVSGKPSSACLSLAARSRTRAASSSCSTRSISSWSRCVLWYAMLHLFYPAGYIGRAAGREVWSLPCRSTLRLTPQSAASRRDHRPGRRLLGGSRIGSVTDSPLP